MLHDIDDIDDIDDKRAMCVSNANVRGHSGVD